MTKGACLFVCGSKDLKERHGKRPIFAEHRDTFKGTTTVVHQRPGDLPFHYVKTETGSSGKAIQQNYGRENTPIHLLP